MWEHGTNFPIVRCNNTAPSRCNSAGQNRVPDLLTPDRRHFIYPIQITGVRPDLKFLPGW